MAAGPDRRSGADVLHASDFDQSHPLGTVETWVFGLRSLPKFGSSFHPTPAGVRAVADVLIARITETGQGPAKVLLAPRASDPGKPAG